MPDSSSSFDGQHRGYCARCGKLYNTAGDLLQAAYGMELVINPVELSNTDDSQSAIEVEHTLVCRKCAESFVKLIGSKITERFTAWWELGVAKGS